MEKALAQWNGETVLADGGAAMQSGQGRLQLLQSRQW
jgi:hypothetical protein